jgi:hypothetical protein
MPLLHVFLILYAFLYGLIFQTKAMTDKQAETAPAGKLFHFIFSVACYQG